jgi:hypothetical protein
MEDVVIIYDHLEYFKAIWYNLWPFGRYRVWSFGIIFPVLVCLDQEKSGNHAQEPCATTPRPLHKPTSTMSEIR